MFGADVIKAINNGDYFRAEQIYDEAAHYSKGLIEDMKKMLQIAGN